MLHTRIQPIAGYRRKVLVGLLGALALAGAALAATAEEARPPWLQEDVVAAMMAIDLTEAQRPEFGSAVNTLLKRYSEGVYRVMRRRPGDLDTRFKRMLDPVARHMDEEVGAFLTPEQLPAYQAYRDLLCERLIAHAVSQNLLVN